MNENKMSFKRILEILFIPFKPLIDVTRDSREMQVGLVIASVVIYIIPIVFYIAIKNIWIALGSWLFVVWVLKSIGDEFTKSKRSSE